MLMTSGQWDLNALEALEREALEVFDVVDVPDHIRHHSVCPPPPPQLLLSQHPATTIRHNTHTATTPTTAVDDDSVSAAAAAATAGSAVDVMDIELEDHIKHCSCSCNHMGYGNFMDYQTSCFGGLPDVTEHSNRHHQILRREPSLNSASLNISNIHQKVSLPLQVGGGGGGAGGSVGDIITTQTSCSSNTNWRKPSATSSSNEKLNRKGCICACLIILTLTLCALIGILSMRQMYGDRNGDRESHEERMKIVHRLLQDTPLIDGHNDLPWNIRRFAHKRLEYLNFSVGLDHTEPWNKSPWSQTDLLRLNKGLVGGQFWSAYVPCEAQDLDAVQLALEQIDLIQRFTMLYRKHMALVTSSQDIIKTHQNGRLASLIGVEGGHALGSSLGVLRAIYALGARYLTLTHTCDNRWAGSAKSADIGLSPFGRSIIREMNRLGMMIDLSYSSDATARDVLRETRAPVIFSHSAARALCNSTRNIDDDMLREVAENGGIVMVSFYSLYLTCTRVSTIQDVIAHINYIRSIAGVQHIGVGAGYDGIDAPPLGLEDVSKYPLLFSELLKDPNWTEDDLSLLAGKNLLRVFRSVENVRDYWKQAAISPIETPSPPHYSQCSYNPLS